MAIENRLRDMHKPSSRNPRYRQALLVLSVALALLASACSSSADPSQSDEANIEDGSDLESTSTAPAEVAASDQDPAPPEKPPFQVSRISISSGSGAFLHQKISASKAKACLPNGESVPVACFEVADLDIDLTDPALGAAIDSGPWRLYDFDITGTFDTGKLSDITFESATSSGASYSCPDPTDGDYPTWREVRRAFRQWALSIYEGSNTDVPPSATNPYEVTVFNIDLEAFEAICADAPGLQINTIAVPLPTETQPPTTVPEHLDPDAPLVIYLSERGAPGAEGLLTGKLVIEDRCVYLQQPGIDRRTFILFSSVLTYWDAETSAILGNDGSGKFSPYTDGDNIELGGGFMHTGISDNTKWVHAPDPSCDTSSVWTATTMSS